MYGKQIKGNNDTVALACDRDPRCKSFRHTSSKGLGYLCYNSDATDDLVTKSYGSTNEIIQNDWKYCKLDTGEKQ